MNKEVGVDLAANVPEPQLKHEQSRKIAEMVDEMTPEGRQHIYDHIEATKRLLKSKEKEQEKEASPVAS